MTAKTRGIPLCARGQELSTPDCLASPMTWSSDSSPAARQKAVRGFDHPSPVQSAELQPTDSTEDGGRTNGAIYSCLCQTRCRVSRRTCDGETGGAWSGPRRLCIPNGQETRRKAPLGTGLLSKRPTDSVEREVLGDTSSPEGVLVSSRANRELTQDTLLGQILVQQLHRWQSPIRVACIEEHP